MANLVTVDGVECVVVEVAVSATRVELAVAVPASDATAWKGGGG